MPTKNKEKKQKKSQQVIIPKPTKPESTSKLQEPKSSTLKTLEHEPLLDLFCTKLSGGKLSDCPILFTNDSQYFLCAVSKNIKMYSVSTRNLLKVFQGHSNTITSMILNPINDTQFISCGLDGSIRIWCIETTTLLQCFENENQITGICTLDSNTLYVSTKGKTLKTMTIISLYSIKENKLSKFIDPFKTKLVSMCSVLDGSLLVLITRNNLQIVNRDTKKIENHLFGVELTCLATHPTLDCLAVGDMNGAIWLFYFKEGIRSKLHWHSVKVDCLSFTNDGNYLLSGGQECVLVLWQLETKKKDFLPRLSSQINSISASPDHRFYALGHLDNSILIVSSTDMKTNNVTVGLKASKNDSKVYPLLSGMVQDPRSGNIVLSSIPGFIQIYNTEHDQHVSEIEVVSMNRVVKTNGKVNKLPFVQKISFCSKGKWMATVDGLHDQEKGEFGYESHVKFWIFDESTQTYLMNTRIDNPHNTEIVFLKLFYIGKILFSITVSKQGSFKIWEHSSQENIDMAYWFCRSENSFKKYEASHATVSNDGTLVAISHLNAITIWDTLKNTSIALLTSSNPLQHFKKIEFLYKSSWIIAQTPNQLYLYDIVTLSIVWIFEMDSYLLCNDPNSSQFMIISHHIKEGKSIENQECIKSVLRIFNPCSPVPVYVHQLDHLVISCTFTLNNTILILSDNYDIKCFSTVQPKQKPMDQITQIQTLKSNEVFDEFCIKKKGHSNHGIQLESKHDFLDNSMGLNPFKMIDLFFENVLFRNEYEIKSHRKKGKRNQVEKKGNQIKEMDGKDYMEIDNDMEMIDNDVIMNDKVDKVNNQVKEDELMDSFITRDLSFIENVLKSIEFKQ